MLGLGLVSHFRREPSIVLDCLQSACSSYCLLSGGWPFGVRHASNNLTRLRHKYNKPVKGAEPPRKQISAVHDALTSGDDQHAAGYGRPSALRTWRRSSGPHWKAAWDGSDEGRLQDDQQRSQQRLAHDRQQRAQAIWQPDSKSSADVDDDENDEAWPKTAAYRFVGTSRLQPIPDSELPAWQRPPQAASRNPARAAQSAGNAAGGSSPGTVAVSSAQTHRPPIFFPDFTLEMLQLTSEQEAQVKATGWLPEVAFKTQPHVTKLEVRALLESLYGVQVDRVATINYLGKKVTSFTSKGKPRFWRQDDWKKVYVRLRAPPELADTATDDTAAAPSKGFMDCVRHVHRLAPTTSRFAALPT